MELHFQVGPRVPIEHRSGSHGPFCSRFTVMKTGDLSCRRVCLLEIWGQSQQTWFFRDSVARFHCQRGPFHSLHCRMSTRYQYHPIPRFIAVIYEVMCSTSCYIQRRWLRIWTNLFDGQPVSKITIHLPPLVLADTCQHHVICVVVGFVIPRCGSCTCFCPFI